MTGSPATLTIGQLATYAGVTVRAVRHYHQRGLLAEPERDASGYRRYGAQAVLDLIRIRILAEAGVPLARICDLLDAEPAQLAESVVEIDDALQGQIRELQHRRARLAALAGGERMFLPSELVAFLDDLRAFGVSERTVSIERDAWILMLARYPEHGLGWLAEKQASLADPELQRLYRAYDEAFDWDPDDRRLAELAAEAARYVARRDPGENAVWPQNLDATVIALVTSHLDDASAPALQRLDELADES